MSGSEIKGGGRAAMSAACEDAVVSLLRFLREDNTDMPTEHDREREHKRFLKKLVERYQRKKLHKQLNQPDNSSDIPGNGTPNIPSTAGETGGGQIDGSSKVRVELVEATLVTAKDAEKKKKGKSSSSDKKKKSKSKKNDPLELYKLGTKKVMVLARSTSIDELLTQAKSKLRLKQKPTRCFCISDNNIEADLLSDLRGISDGTTLYVTLEPSQSTAPIKGINDNEGGDDRGETTKNTTDSDLDPLDAVKQAYIRQKTLNLANRRSRQQQSTGKKQRPHNRGDFGSHPPFSNFFDKLPQLTAPRSELPAAACRETFLSSVERNRIVIVCGSTGCGKSSQLPQFLLEGMVAAQCDDQAHIIVTQPRRVAATSLAHRVAYEMNSSPPGQSGSIVGYNVRLDRKIADNTTKIVYCTVGILLRMLVCPQQSEDIFDDNEDTNEEKVECETDDQSSPSPAFSRDIPLGRVSHVVIDEVSQEPASMNILTTVTCPYTAFLYFTFVCYLRFTREI